MIFLQVYIMLHKYLGYKYCWRWYNWISITQWFKFIMEKMNRIFTPGPKLPKRLGSAMYV